MDRLPSRLREKIDIQLDGCWLWTGHRMKNGYGQAWFGGRVTTAHRAVYQAAHGLVLPKGFRLVVDHLCRNTLCVNPAHLEAVSNRVNTLRGRPGTRIRRGTCSVGHALADDNLRYSKKSRHYICRLCTAAYQQAYMRSYYPAHPEKWGLRRAAL